MTTDRDITYLRARYSLSVLPDDPDVDDPYFIFIVNEFGIGQGWRFGTEMPSMPFLRPLRVLNPSPGQPTSTVALTV